jgi:hypothetical protein
VEKVRPYDIQKFANSLKLRKACGLYGIPNECHWNTDTLFNLCLWLSHFPKSWMEAKLITLPKPNKDPKFPQNLRPINLLSITGNIFEKVILKIVQRHAEIEACLMQASLVSVPVTARHFNV